MSDFTYKWGEDVRAGIYSWWPIAEKQGLTKVEFLIYAFDLLINEDSGKLKELIKASIEANPDMVAKAKKNPKLANWFIGQVMKLDSSFDPKALLEEVNKQLEVL